MKMIEIYLYGKLRRYAKNTQANQESVIKIEIQPDETIESLLARVGISVDEIYHIFVNSRLLATYNTMASWHGYPLQSDDPYKWDLKLPVKSGDRIGLFGKDLALLVI